MAGRGGPIRTGDHLNPIQVRYQAALRPDSFIIADSRKLRKSYARRVIASAAKQSPSWRNKEIASSLAFSAIRGSARLLRPATLHLRLQPGRSSQ